MKSTRTLVISASLAALTVLAALAAQTNAYNNGSVARHLKHGINNDDESIKPLTFLNTNSHVLYYVESDGRHVAAIAKDGKLLWHRNPFVDAKLEPYRYSKPVIRSISSPGGSRISIVFNSSQFGSLDPKTGDFRFGGQD